MKKLLVWDGDDTLWNGTLAEGDTPTLPPGRWELCEALSNRGVLQALATHNREESVKVALHTLGLEPFFLYNQAAFGPPKSAMVRAIVQDYELSKYSDVVFVDDSTFNRAEVVTALPLVTVIGPDEFPEASDVYFFKEYYTDEDRLRVRRYQSEAVRRHAAVAYGEDYATFLRSCELVMEIRRAEAADLPRVVDLIQRANRMAALSRVFSEVELRMATARRIGGSVWVAKVRDKFGDYGLSAVMITDVRSSPDPIKINALVVSCRLQGRGIGSAFIGWLINRYSVGTAIVAEWQETEYNAGMRGLYEWYGFNIGEDSSRWIEARFTKRGLVDMPDWVQVEGANQ